MRNTVYRELKANVVYTLYSGKCVLNIFAYLNGVPGCVLTVYDNTADSGIKVFELLIPKDPRQLSLDFKFENGICVKATEDVTIVYTLTH